MKTISSRDIPGLVAVTVGAGILIAGILRRRRRISFRGASIIVTGGSRGLGLEISRILAREGARLTLIARNRQGLERARRELIGLGGYVQVRACTIADPEEAQRAVDSVIRERGRIDVLVNNAGVMQVGPFEHSDIQDYEEAIDAHVRGPINLVLAALPFMKRQGRGRIVNISSIGGIVALPHMLPYSTSKFALTGLSQGLRAELSKDGILVTTVVPGLMRTGSVRNASFKGRHKQEFRWFARAGTAPFLSLNAERAAHRIVEACRYGEPYVVIGLPARILQKMNALFPGLTAAVMRQAARLLPLPANAGGDVRMKGAAIDSGEGRFPAPAGAGTVGVEHKL